MKIFERIKYRILNYFIGGGGREIVLEGGKILPKVSAKFCGQRLLLVQNFTKTNYKYY